MKCRKKMACLAAAALLAGAGLAPEAEAADTVIAVAAGTAPAADAQVSDAGNAGTTGDAGAATNAARASADTGTAESDWPSLKKLLEERRSAQGQAQGAAKPPAQEEKDARFQEILRDESYIYYVDTKNTRWITKPHSGGEKIIDAWIRLVDVGIGTGSYSYPKKYFLEHYYIRPDKQQIQFLCELEVVGRPQNAIKQRAYSDKNWEELVPESVEDVIYHAVSDRMKAHSPTAGIFPDGMSTRDIVEEYLRISL